MKDSFEPKKNARRNAIEHPKPRKSVPKKKSLNFNKKAVILVIFIVIFIGFACLFLFSNNDLNDKTDSISTSVDMLSNTGKNNVEAYKIDEKNTLLTVGPSIEKNKDNVNDTKNKAEGFNELFHLNTNSKTAKSIMQSNISLSLVKLEDSYIFEDKETKEKLLVVFDYTTATRDDGTEQKIIEHGYVYSLKKDKIEQVYKTPYLFGNAAVDNGKLVIYERLPKDDTNMYPSYLKPYERVKMVYENGEFNEKQRHLVEPIKEYTENSKK